MTWMITTASSRSRATVSSSMPRSSGPIQTRRASATSVEGTACGSTVVMTCIAWALPMRWRRAERYHRTSRSTSLVWHRTSGRWRSPVRPRLPTSPIAGSVAGQSRTPALRHQRTFAQHGSSEGVHAPGRVRSPPRSDSRTCNNPREPATCLSQASLTAQPAARPGRPKPRAQHARSRSVAQVPQAADLLGRYFP